MNTVSPDGKRTIGRNTFQNDEDTMKFQAPIATGRSVTGVPTGRLALWWVLASEIVIFGGFWDSRSPKSSFVWVLEVPGAPNCHF